ncbi:PREDICTED: zinc finger protein CONSTANS-LIKE 9 [Nelumbo nucifera]|uniref:Zinc finger protein CONSTANS-LIKE 9 n=1 Tax=Nelumbo nucifera TaxID=4432 RepID=A0A1U8Q9E8_NELNU|nr:PREDICTED: zinc finger protein CONSTANS-LIKE 9 [Nelumbo nucifera]
MKECELCNHPARMFCESDQASLCWDCDAKVHGANFLVARHSRSLLCHVCQSPTPWKASGAKLGPTVSVCEKCVNSSHGREDRAGGVVVRTYDESQGRNEDEIDRDADDEDDVDDDDDDEDEDEDENEDDEDDDDDDDGDDNDNDDDGENQVVPWSSTPPPPAASSSSSDESSSSGGRRGAESGISYSFKRMRENADLCYQNDLGYSSFHPNSDNNNRALVSPADRDCLDDEATSYCSLFTHSKHLKGTVTESTSAPHLSSLKRFRQEKLVGRDTPATILGISAS